MSDPADIKDVLPANRTVIVGAGIVGSCLASILATQLKDTDPLHRVILVDRDVEGLPGSTGHAPGYVGQFNQIPVLTELAKRTVEHYQKIQGGFSTVGGLEIAESATGTEQLKERCDAAVKVGLEAHMVSRDEATNKAPFFVRGGSNAAEKQLGVLWFPTDGTANAQLIARTEQSNARKAGAILINADVKTVLPASQSSGLAVIELNSGERIEAARVAICTGIWTKQLCPALPVVAVAHPYSYTPSRDAERDLKTPFVRYPQSHVYVRDHGLRDGMGSYDHDPIAVATANLTSSAYGDWKTSFEDVLSHALRLLPEETRATFDVSPTSAGVDRVFNGIFSVTPDGMPIVGQVGDFNSGVYVASAIWVTHAAACARLIADVMLSSTAPEDEWMLKALHPNRFEGKDLARLDAAALGTYNDIYNKNASA
ncbi:FAD dependent oxidoreductase [Testicularia cyperi]|uniref:FAD dependent oxidoreductase n=1 Tax=Testicularia cyperi TaxID=1882483 RepID=A0A317XEI5_9BASI|nr:FAD dependent oxidoreductase [Testicularia cyperi]